jgi:hypothetical protein
MSPRAAWRLERLGFGPVFDYTLGKVDWMAAGLPTVRADLSVRRVIDEIDRDPRTCPPDAFVRDVGTTGRYVIVINNDETQRPRDHRHHSRRGAARRPAPMSISPQ